jgi:hypothetical protein
MLVNKGMYSRAITVCHPQRGHKAFHFNIPIWHFDIVQEVLFDVKKREKIIAF